MHLFVVVYLVYNVVIVLSIERMMGVFFEKRRTHIVLFVLSFLLYYVLSGFAFLMWNIPIISIMTTLFTYFIITLNYESTMSKRIAAAICIFFVIVIVGELLAHIAFAGERVQLLEYAASRNIPSFIFIVSGLLIYPVSVFFRKFKNIRKQSFKSPLYYYSYTFIPFISLATIIFIFGQIYLAEHVIISITIAIFAINILAVFLLDRLSASYEKNLKSALLEQERDYYLSQLHLMQESMDKVNSIRHDMKLQLNTLREFSARDNSENVTAYLNTLIAEVGKSETYSQTGNIVIDSLTNFKFTNAKQDNINLDLQLFVPPAFDMEETDLVTILGNLLDNALEAVEKTEEKIIRLEMKYDIGSLHITLENSFNGEIKQSK